MAAAFPAAPALHTLSDGSALRLMSARELITIPVWNGNRSINEEHARSIAEHVGSNLRALDSTPYRIIQYQVPDAEGKPVLASFLIDGQHRASVLRKGFSEGICEPDFPVIVIIKSVESEFDAIGYFKTINTVKSIVLDDYKIVVNEYISELCAAFNTRKKLFLKPGSVKRPNLSTDRLRELLEAQKDRLALDKSEIRAFVERVKEWNRKRCEEVALSVAYGTAGKDSKLLEACCTAGFILAADPKLPWISALLS